MIFRDKVGKVSWYNFGHKKDQLPVSMQLPADPENNIWYFYNTLTCTAYLDGHKILFVLTLSFIEFAKTFTKYIKVIFCPYLRFKC